ncbi:hypothetical protein CRYUN_Cryun02cG0104000 [Craigia yunnanensis]
MAVLASQQPQLIFNGSFLFSSPNLQFHHRSATIFRWRFGRDQGSNLVTCRTKGQAFRILANPNVSSGKGDPGNEVIMVDPLEAKRLASKQMEQIKAKEKFKVIFHVNEILASFLVYSMVLLKKISVAGNCLLKF